MQKYGLASRESGRLAIATDVHGELSATILFNACTGGCVSARLVAAADPRGLLGTSLAKCLVGVKC